MNASHTVLWTAAALSIACGAASGGAGGEVSAPTPPGGVAAAAGVGEPDDSFLAVAELEPSFGGLYVDAAQRLAVVTTDVTRLAPVLDAVAAVFGAERFAAYGAPYAVPGQYGWVDLHRWRLALGGVFGFPGVTTLDTDERENRIVVGLSDLGAGAPIILWLSRIGVPREAVLFVYAPLAVPL